MALSSEEIGVRYGRAFFDYAKDANCLSELKAELDELRAAIDENPELLNLLSDPVLNSSEKSAVIDAIKQPFSVQAQEILSLLLTYDRYDDFDEIVDYFDRLYYQDQQIAHGVVTSATSLSDEQVKQIGAAYAERFGIKRVELDNKVDASLIGGVVLEVGDHLIDGSIKNRLNKLRAQLSKQD